VAPQKPDFNGLKQTESILILAPLAVRRNGPKE
jgi:hypothetical protein